MLKRSAPLSSHISGTLERGVPSSKDIEIRPSRSMRIVVTTSCYEGGSGKHHRGGTSAHTHTHTYIHSTTSCHGERIEFLMASVYSHGRRQEVRDASTRCSRINVRAIPCAKNENGTSRRSTPSAGLGDAAGDAVHLLSRVADEK